MTSFARRASLAVMVLTIGVVGLGACASDESDACLSGLKYDGRLYREQAAIDDLPTGASLGAATDGRCSETAPVKVIDTTVVKLQGVEPSIAVVVEGVDGSPDTLWVARSVDLESPPAALEPYLR